MKITLRDQKHTMLATFSGIWANHILPRVIDFTIFELDSIGDTGTKKILRVSKDMALRIHFDDPDNSTVIYFWKDSYLVVE